LRRFTVRAALPAPLEPLGDLVANLRWSWNPDALDLFDAVDPDGWERCEHDPVNLLGEVGADRMLTLAKDRRFLRRLNDAYEDLDDYLTADRWYQGLGE
jgi:starch phosphorylase